MSKFKISKKFSGVYSYELKNKDTAYYIGVNTSDKKYIKIKVGKKSEGITEQYCHMKRIEYLNKQRLGENPILGANKKQEIVLFDTFAQAYLSYLDDEKRTGYCERNKYNVHLKDRFGSMDVRKITPEHINELKKALKEGEKADATIRHIMSFISFVYNYMIKNELYDGVNPMKSPRVKLPKINNARNRFLTLNDIEILLATIKDEKLLDTFVRFALSTGARVSALLAIQKKDIDSDNRVIALNDYKSSSTYFGHLNSKLFPSLDFLNELKPNDYVIGIEGKKINPTTVQLPLRFVFNKLFNQGLDRKDIKNRVVVHTLRHTFASLLAINGTPIYSVQQLMNHKEIKMTMRYAKLSPDSCKTYVDNLF